MDEIHRATGSGGVKDFLSRAKAAGHGGTEITAYLKSIATESPGFAFDGLARLMPAEDFRKFLEGLFREQGARDFPQAVEMLSALDGANFTLAASAMMPPTPSGDPALAGQLTLLFGRFPEGPQRKALERPDFTSTVMSRLWSAQYPAETFDGLLRSPAFAGPLRDSLAWYALANGTPQEEQTVGRVAEILARSGPVSEDAVKRLLETLSNHGKPQDDPAGYTALAGQLAPGQGREIALLEAIRHSPAGAENLPELLTALPPEKAQAGLRIIASTLLQSPFNDALRGLQKLTEDQQLEAAGRLAAMLAEKNREADARQLLKAYPTAPWRQQVEKRLEMPQPE